MFLSRQVKQNRKVVEKHCSNSFPLNVTGRKSMVGGPMKTQLNRTWWMRRDQFRLQGPQNPPNKYITLLLTSERETDKTIVDA